ncbi:hypothetical protein CR513_29935, partial [Mucuna pruriens]
MDMTKLITLESGSFALLWWMQCLDDLKRHGTKDSCKDCEALKNVMRARLVPTTYTKDLHDKL